MSQSAPLKVGDIVIKIKGIGKGLKMKIVKIGPNKRVKAMYIHRKGGARMQSEANYRLERRGSRRSPKRKRGFNSSRLRSAKRKLKSRRRRSPSRSKRRNKKRARVALMPVDREEIIINNVFAEPVQPALSRQEELLALMGYSTIGEMCAAESAVAPVGNMTSAQKKYMRKLASMEKKYEGLDLEEDEDIIDWDDDHGEEQEYDDDDDYGEEYSLNSEYSKSPSPRLMGTGGTDGRTHIRPRMRHIRGARNLNMLADMAVAQMGKVYIKTNDLAFIQRELLPQDREFCGNLLKKKNTLALEVEESGRQGNGPDGRPLCNFNRFTKYVWHTHQGIDNTRQKSEQIVVGSFPSAEDILTPCFPNNNPIISSILFSQWGVWEIHAVNKQDLTYDQRLKMVGHINWAGPSEDKKQPIKIMVDGTEDGKAARVNEYQIYLINNYIKSVVDFLYNFAKIELQMTFTPWSQITGSYTLNFQ